MMGKVTSDGARSELGRLRDLHGEIKGLQKQYGEAPAPIDWEFYRNNLKASRFVVDEFQSAYDKMELKSYSNEVKSDAD